MSIELSEIPSPRYRGGFFIVSTIGILYTLLTVKISPRVAKVLEYATMLDPVRAYAGVELGGTTPNKRSAKRALTRLDKGMDKQVDAMKAGASVPVNYVQHVPPGDTRLQTSVAAAADPLTYMSSSPAGADPTIHFNPHSDRAYLAHEMGHLASQQSDVGQFIAALRANPKLATALGAAMFAAPAVASAVEVGDDDLDTSIALAALASAPTLADEALATRQGLAIMDKAGMRATLGQRGKLAGGLMSYLAAPILAASLGNTVGNQLD